MAESAQAQLAEVSALLTRNRASDAETALLVLLKSVSFDQLQLLRPDILGLIERFHKKKCRDLSLALEQALGTRRAAPKGQQKTGATRSTDDSMRDYQTRLAQLRDFHIFQWNTFYRDTFSYIFKDLLQRTDEDLDHLLPQTARAVAGHAREVYERGHRHVTVTLAMKTDVAFAKSLSGFQKFLLLILETYSNLVPDITTADAARRVRAVCSTLINSILVGYGSAEFGAERGVSILQKYPWAWLHSAAFLTGEDARVLGQSLPQYPGSVGDDFRKTLTPVFSAIDRLLATRRASDVILPRISQYLLDPPRLQLSLTLPKNVEGERYLTVTCFLGGIIEDDTVVAAALERDTTVIAVQLHPRVREWLEAAEARPKNLVDTTQVGSLSDHEHSVAERTFDIIVRALAKYQGQDPSKVPLTHNYARDFPLENPVLRRYFIVQRHSVRQLLHMFDNDNGVHLWCSVRRSGKTTACVDLAGVTAKALVLIQTMDQQPHQPELNIFYDRVTAAIRDALPLPAQFVQEVVKECAVASTSLRLNAPKKILVIDEYETLFGHLRAAMRRDPELQFTVVQPLLSQLVSFAQVNLLILIGQRPDSHYIAMDQNQLSPLVRQDHFPLFQHAPGGIDTEFTQLLKRVLSERVTFSPAFADGVYAETSGHPYLTVNMLVDLFQWLIEEQRQTGAVALEGDDFTMFTRERLSAGALQRSSHYSFFSQMISSYLSEQSREQTPWLYAVMSVLQRIGKEHARTFYCTEPKYKQLAEEPASACGLSVEQLLQTAVMANFLSVRGGQVGAAIQILGRLAAVARPHVN